MSFDSFCTSRITIEKKDGSTIQDVAASVQKNKVFINTGNILIEAGDLVRHEMSNGAIDMYRVIDPGFHEAVLGFDPHYQMEVQKLTRAATQGQIKSATYNFHGNSRMNNNSIDNSQNFFAGNKLLLDRIAELQHAVSSSALSENEKATASEIVSAMEMQARSSQPSFSVMKALVSTLPTLANIATIGSLILQAMK